MVPIPLEERCVVGAQDSSAGRCCTGSRFYLESSECGRVHWDAVGEVVVIGDQGKWMAALEGEDV